MRNSLKFLILTDINNKEISVNLDSTNVPARENWFDNCVLFLFTFFYFLQSLKHVAFYCGSSLNKSFKIAWFVLFMFNISLYA